jgi:hypothetical protein
MESVFAYLDPGSGSMIVQLIVGGLAAAGVALKLWWNKILRFLRIKKAEPAKAKPAAAQPSAPAATQPAADAAAQPDTVQR